MKKLILVTACAAFAAASYAQTPTQDTTKSKSQSQQTDQLRNRSTEDQGDMKGWMRVESANIPANLRQTLSNGQYSGWESGTIYRNETGDTYSLRTGTGTSQKTYYFDKNGKATKKPNGN